MDYGLQQGLNQGLGKFIDTYIATKDREDSLSEQRKKMALEAAHGEADLTGNQQAIQAYHELVRQQLAEAGYKPPSSRPASEIAPIQLNPPQPQSKLESPTMLPQGPAQGSLVQPAAAPAQSAASYLPAPVPKDASGNPLYTDESKLGQRKIERDYKKVEMQKAIGEIDKQDYEKSQRGVVAKKTGAEAQNAQNEATFKLTNEYAQDPIVKDMKETQFNFNKMVNAAKQHSPLASKSLVFNFIRLENPNAVAREGTLEDVRKNPDLMQRYGDFVNMAYKGDLPQNTKNDFLRTAAGVLLSARDMHKPMQEKFVSLAKSHGADPMAFSEPGIENAEKQARELLEQTPEYVPPAAGLMDKTKSLIKSFTGAPANAQQLDPVASKYAEDHGLEYSDALQLLKTRGVIKSNGK